MIVGLLVCSLVLVRRGTAFLLGPGARDLPSAPRGFSVAPNVCAPSWPVVVELSPGEACQVVSVEDLLLQLLTRVQQDDEAAFAVLHRLTWHRLRRAVCRVTGTVELAEDVLQDAYLLIWRQRHQFRADRGSVMGWMMTIARRRAIDGVRSVSRSRHLEHRTAVAEPVTVTDHQAAVVEALDAAALTRPLLDELTCREREAVVMTYWDGRSAAEAAQLLGIPVPTLKSRLHAGMTRLRQLLEAAPLLDQPSHRPSPLPPLALIPQLA